MYVCVPCRDANPTWNPEYLHSCGERLVSSPRNWAPPRKNNERAWKRIENGEWLWDRRRVRRNPPPAVYIKSSWVRMPTYKKGQPSVFQPNVSAKNGPSVDLGG